MRQKQALRIMMEGKNVFLTGAPGAGKTFVLNEFVARARRRGKTVAVTASTGIAATHLGGTTIHSWSGLGIRDQLSSEDTRLILANQRLVKRYNATDTLVIDEVSMLHGFRLDMINTLAKLLRNKAEPFGGMQVILVGDLFQLPPVNRLSAALDFVHLSDAWQELAPTICYLTEQHRQDTSDGLLVLLEAMRRGELDEMHKELIQSRLGQLPPDHQPVTRLYAHNIDVESINQHHLEALQDRGHSYYMQSKGNKARSEQLIKSVLAPETLVLKKNAEVMFVANNFAEGYVNGSRGRVIDFAAETPVVELLNGRVIRVEPYSWSLSEDGRVRAEVSQLPLRLAWAITIHKSQGMSLDAAHIDLSRAFTPGMGYVALSRVRSLQGLYLTGINPMALTMHANIYELDRLLRRASADLQTTIVDIDDETTDNKSASAEIDELLLEKLRGWRYQRALSDQVAPYMIAHNTALSAVAMRHPATPEELIALPGFGSRKVEVYGADILALVAVHDHG